MVGPRTTPALRGFHRPPELRGPFS
jgi:hypothetical protein